MAGRQNNTVRVWLLTSTTRPPLRTLRGHSSAVHSLSGFLGDDDEPLLASACKDLDVRVWSLLDGSLLKVLRGNTNPITSVWGYGVSPVQGGQFQRHGAVIVSSCARGNIKVWNFATGEVIRYLNGHSESIGAMTALAVGCASGSLSLTAAAALDNERGTGHEDFSAPSASAAAHPISETSIYRSATTEAEPGPGPGRELGGTWAAKEPEGVAATRDEAISSGGLLIISGSKDCTVRTWLLAEERTLKILPHGERNKVTCMTVFCPREADVTSSSAAAATTAPIKRLTTPGGLPIIITGADDGKLRAWGIDSSQSVVNTDLLDEQNSQRFSNTSNAASAAHPESRLGRPRSMANGGGAAAGGSRISSRSSNDAGVLLWEMSAHTAQITALCVYIPLPIVSPTYRHDPPVEMESRRAEQAHKASGSVSQRPRSARVDPSSSSSSSSVMNHSIDNEVHDFRADHGKEAFDVENLSHDHYGCDTSGEGSGRGVATTIPAHLEQVLIISCCREGMVRLSSIEHGMAVTPMWEAHLQVLTCVCVCPGVWSGVPYSPTPFAIDPFFVTGSEDNLAKVWSLADFNCRHVLKGHIFDVTSVDVHTQQPPSNLQQAAGNDQRDGVDTVKKEAAKHSNQERSDQMQPNVFDPIIVTGSMDNTVNLWCYSRGTIIATLDDPTSNVHVTSVAVVPFGLSEGGPMVIAGDGDGTVSATVLQ